MENFIFDENLRKIYDTFGRVELIPLKKVAEFLGVYDRSLLSDKNFPVKKILSRHYVSAVALANWLS